jgi:hypothetical protein
VRRVSHRSGFPVRVHTSCFFFRSGWKPFDLRAVRPVSVCRFGLPPAYTRRLGRTPVPVCNGCAHDAARPSPTLHPRAVCRSPDGWHGHGSSTKLRFSGSERVVRSLSFSINAPLSGGAILGILVGKACAHRPADNSVTRSAIFRTPRFPLRPLSSGPSSRA